MSSLRGRPEVLTALILSVLSLGLLIAGTAMSDDEGASIGAGLAWLTAIGTTISALIAWAVAFIAARRR